MKTESMMDRPRSGKSRSGQSEENAAAVREAFDLSQAKSIRRTSLESNISATSIQTILSHELRLFRYKSQAIQKPESQDYEAWCKFVKLC